MRERFCKVHREYKSIILSAGLIMYPWFPSLSSASVSMGSAVRLIPADVDLSLAKVVSFASSTVFLTHYLEPTLSVWAVELCLFEYGVCIYTNCFHKMAVDNWK